MPTFFLREPLIRLFTIVAVADLHVLCHRDFIYAWHGNVILSFCLSGEEQGVRELCELTVPGSVIPEFLTNNLLRPLTCGNAGRGLQHELLKMKPDLFC
jgi:hypothetical protein